MLRKLILSYYIVKVIALLCRSSVIPEYSRSYYFILIVQNYQTVHLPSEAYSRHLIFVSLGDKLLYALYRIVIPVLRILLRPSRMRKIQGVFPGHDIYYPAPRIHQQQLYRRRPQINADI
mgnify:CR=1 FL=1